MLPAAEASGTVFGVAQGTNQAAGEVPVLCIIKALITISSNLGK